MAKPVSLPDGSLNMMIWECSIPGREKSPWAGGRYNLRLTFSQTYPSQPPKVVFSPPIPHPNVFSCGSVCLSLLQGGWKPAITVKQILLGVQALLDEPNLNSPANHSASELLRKNKAGYEKAVKAYAAKHSPRPDADDGSIIIL